MAAPSDVTLLEERRRHVDSRLTALRAALTSGDVDLEGKACVYVTGSFGRGEASLHSDLDLFIVGLTEGDGAGNPRRLLSAIDEALLKADLIRAARSLGFPEFDREGGFLVHHSLRDLVGTLGHPQDDVVNTFTARLLLLLESQTLLGDRVYEHIIEKVGAAYWIDFEGREDRFIPAFLANDILRLWRTFCVNYEAFTKREPDREKAKRKLKNYKLRHSRLITCYSALAHLLETYRKNGTVRPEDVRHMVGQTPTGRLQSLVERHQGSVVAEHGSRCIELYEEFLTTTDAPQESMIETFLDRDKRRGLAEAENRFGDEMFGLLRSIDPEGGLFRLLVI